MMNSGKPVELVTRANFKFTLNENAISYFTSSGFQDMDVAVVTIAGPGRYGKSFILNFFLRYATHRYSEGHNPDDWLKDLNRPLTGFPWEKESERTSTAINMWPEFFVCNKTNGQKICIIFLDTQTGDERNTSAAEYSCIYAICSMISSVLILNVGSSIQETYLQQIEVFAEYGKMAIADSGVKPYQQLLFLVRDWRSPFQYPYGFDGGQLYLKQYLDSESEDRKAVKELTSPRENIPNAFQDIQCFLMPRPGEVATYGISKEFQGSLKGIDPKFVSNLGVLVPKILSPENLIAKTINGQKVNVKELYVHLMKWVDLFNGPTMPVPTSMFNATVEANNEAAKENALNWFKEEVSKSTGKNYMDEEKLKKTLMNLENLALKKFDEYHKMGGSKYSQPHRDSLQLTLKIVRENCEEENANLAHPWAKLMREWGNRMCKIGQAVGFLLFILVVNDFLAYLEIHKLNEVAGRKIPVMEFTFAATLGFILYVYLTYE
uniref:Atlastin n=1 Tax=Lygus hesperus TaxID=30085 RepID=A0A0A9Y186_LYGHE